MGGVMLRNNNDNISNLRWLGGGYFSGSLDTTGDQNKIYNNGLAFGMKVGKPYGYNGLNGILLPVQPGGFIRATLSGNTDFAALISSIANMQATLSGVSTLSPGINAAYNMYLTMIGEGNLTPALKAKAWMWATMDAGARPSAFDIAQEIWQAQASQYNATGTMGSKVNSSGSSGNPWTQVVEGSMSTLEAIKIILSVLVGKTTIIKGTNGNATIKFRNVSDTKDKVTASMNESSRTNVTLNTD
jgi:hypothetical protein